MKLRITEAVLAEAYRAKVCRERMEELAESIRKSVKERYSLPKMRIRLAEYGNDTELMLAAVSALRKDKEAPSARDRDFRAWMLMLCRSREHEVICYMCNELTDAWERKYRTREMLVLCDVLHTLKGHARTNEMTNRVCDYFFRERRNKLYGKTFRIEEKDMAYAESRLPELDKAVFRMTVNHYSHRTFVAEELAGLCGMGYSLMRRKFKTYYGYGAIGVAAPGADKAHRGGYGIPGGTAAEGSGRAQRLRLGKQFCGLLPEADRNESVRTESHRI